MPVFTFAMSEVLPLIHSSLMAARRTPTFGQQSEGGRGRARMVPPGLVLVGDHGVYLLSNAEGQASVQGAGLEAGRQRMPLAYAIECNPEKMDFDEWHEAKVGLYGGDDGSDFLPHAGFLDVIIDQCSKSALPIHRHVLQVHMEDETLRVVLGVAGA